MAAFGLLYRRVGGTEKVGEGDATNIKELMQLPSGA
jgi:hypothetical protein